MEINMKTNRPDVRESLRPEEPANDERLARRLAELRNHNNANLDEGVDKFATPTPQPGWSYEWKMKSVNGWEDPSHHNRISMGGWETVEAKRHPEMMPKGHSGAIEREGMLLCERPLEITQDRRARDLQNARNQVKTKEGQLDPKGRGGLMNREDANARMKVNKDHNLYVPEQ
jgi:hypothetical protein